MSAITKLYDSNGSLLGMWNRETGRVQLGMDFYVPERTCFDASGTDESFMCSLCGTAVESECSDSQIYVGNCTDDFSYCPACWAKVVDER